MEKMETRPYDEKTVDRYRQAIFLHRIEDFHREFYLVFITLENDEFITEEISYEKLPCFEGKTAMRSFHEEN